MNNEQSVFYADKFYIAVDLSEKMEQIVSLIVLYLYPHII